MEIGRKLRRVLLRVDAAVNAAAGLLLLSASWGDLYQALDLPVARPAVYAQMAGVLLLGLAYLLWVSPVHRGMTRPVGTMAAAVNVAGAGLIVAWLTVGGLHPEPVGRVLLIGFAAVLIVLAVAVGSVRGPRHR